MGGQTNAALTLGNLQPPDFTDYTVLVTNTDGSVLGGPAHLTLAVQPAISAPGFAAGDFTLTFPTELGPAYIVEYKDDLADTSWQALGLWAGTGLPLTVTNTSATNAMRFYRIRMQ